jgi:acyl carrier protein
VRGGAFSIFRTIYKMIEKQDIQNAVFEAMEQVNRLLPRNLRLNKSLDELLVARDSKLDSLGLINFLVGCEEQIEIKTGKKIILTGETNYADEYFGTIGRLIEYISGKLAGN